MLETWQDWSTCSPEAVRVIASSTFPPRAAIGASMRGMTLFTATTFPPFCWCGQGGTRKRYRINIAVSKTPVYKHSTQRYV